MAFLLFDRFAQISGMIRFSERLPEINEQIVIQLPLHTSHIKSQTSLDFIRGFFANWYDHTAPDLRVEGSSLAAPTLPDHMQRQLLELPSMPCVLVNPQLDYNSEISGVIPLREIFHSAYWCSFNTMVPGTEMFVSSDLEVSQPRVKSKLIWNGNTYK